MNGLSKDKAFTVLTFEGRRDGYSPEQCLQTCTVGELIEALQEYDPEMLVFTNNDGGYTYGSIDVDSFEVEEFYDDNDEDEEEDKGED